MIASDAYFLGGRSLTAGVIAGALMLTDLSPNHLIGLNGEAFKYTIAVTAWQTTSASAMVRDHRGFLRTSSAMSGGPPRPFGGFAG